MSEISAPNASSLLVLGLTDIGVAFNKADGSVEIRLSYEDGHQQTRTCQLPYNEEPGVDGKDVACVSTKLLLDLLAERYQLLGNKCTMVFEKMLNSAATPANFMSIEEFRKQFPCQKGN